MLKRISVSLAVLYLAATVFSVLTKGGLDACCAAAPIPCARLAAQKTGQGQDWRAEADKEIACVAERLARKQAELRVLNVQPNGHAWRKDMTRTELNYLKELVEGKQASLKGGN